MTMRSYDKRLDEIEGFALNSPVAAFTYADGSRRSYFRPGMKIMQAIDNIDEPAPASEKVTHIEPVIGTQSDLLISLFDALKA